MTAERLTDDQGRTLVRLLGLVREDWNALAIAAGVRALADRHSPAMVCAIATACAADVAAKTPDRMTTDHYAPVVRPLGDFAPSVGRDNVARIRAEQLELEARKAGPHQIAAIRASQAITNPRSEP